MREIQKTIAVKGITGTMNPVSVSRGRDGAVAISGNQGSVTLLLMGLEVPLTAGNFLEVGGGCVVRFSPNIAYGLGLREKLALINSFCSYKSKGLK